MHTGKDFALAAFIFQHGSTKGDFLLAHVLALGSLAHGDQDAAWIAGASPDAYLQAVGQSQVLGTRFVLQDGKTIPKIHYDPALISEVLRQ